MKEPAMAFLTHAQYLQQTADLGGGHWKNAPTRWIYHEAAISILREIGLTSPGEVLEMGTRGISILPGSDTIDHGRKRTPGRQPPTILHDPRQLPWPIADGAYGAFVALRVFHRLHPVQRACFLEARRIARTILIVVPETHDLSRSGDGARGIPAATFTEWNDGVPPTLVVRFARWIGNLYFWDETALRPRSGGTAAP